MRNTICLLSVTYFKLYSRGADLHFGGILKQVGGKMLGKMAPMMQLGGNLGHLEAHARPKRAQGNPRGRNARSHSYFVKGLLQVPIWSLTQRAAAAGLIASRIPPGRVDGRWTQPHKSEDIGTGSQESPRRPEKWPRRPQQSSDSPAWPQNGSRRPKIGSR